MATRSSAHGPAVDRGGHVAQSHSARGHLARFRVLPRLGIAVGAASLLAGLAFTAAPIVAAVARQPVTTQARDVVTSVDRQRDVELPIAASHIELHWSGSPLAQVAVAFPDATGQFGAANPLDTDDSADSSVDGAEPPGEAAKVRGSGAPDDQAVGARAPALEAPETWSQVIVADGARSVRITSDQPIARLTVLAMDTRGSAAAAAADAAAEALAPEADASVGEPAIISRAAWGADESLRFDSGGYERFARSYFPLQKLIVHHTDGRNDDPDPAATIRAIYYFHAVTRDAGDIDYNFLIDAQGHVYEGRYSRAYAPGEPITGENLAGNPVRAAHARDFNAGTVGIALLGTFTSVQPTTAARNALINLLAWETERHGLNPLGTSTYVNPETGLSKVLPTIAGHRDVNPTACPGTAFYETFPTLRQQVAAKVSASEGLAVDATPPTGVLSPLLTPTGGSTMTFGLVFDEAVTGVTAGDFAVGGSSAGWTVTNVSGKAASYTITVASSAPSDGTVELSLPGGSVSDLSGNLGPPTALDATATFTTDTSRPSLVLWATPHRSATNVDLIDVSVNFSEPVLGLTPADVQIRGSSDAVTPWTTNLVVGSGATYGFTVTATNPANGSLILTVPDGATTDPAGNPNLGATITIAIDRTPPKTSVPMTTLRTGGTFSGALAGLVTWSGSDLGGAGIASYDIERSRDGAAFAAPATGLASPQLIVSLSAGHTYRYAVRARDQAGNVGAWRAGPTFSTIVRQDSSGYLAWSGPWHVAAAKGHSGGGVHDATAAGASMRYTFTGRAIALVSTVGPAHGAVKIYLDGKYVTTVDTGATTSADRQVVWSHAWSASGSHTLKLVVVRTPGRPRVDVDAVLVLK